MGFSCTCGEALVGEEAICECCSGAHFKRWSGRLDTLSEQMFEAGAEGAIAQCIAAIDNDRQERQPSAMWPGMKQAIAVLEAVRAGTYQFTEPD
jgi:hypothetical protein